MSDSVSRGEPAPIGSSTRKPTWWTDSLEVSWNKAKADAIRDWDELVDGEEKLEHRLDHEAIAFGYGAHQAFAQFKVWGGQVEDLLKADWRETGHDAHCAWDKARAAAKHGWERLTP